MNKDTRGIPLRNTMNLLFRLKVMKHIRLRKINYKKA